MTQTLAPRPSSARRLVVLATFGLGALCGGLFGFVLSGHPLQTPGTPAGRILAAAYRASISDDRPRGFSARDHEAAEIWDDRNAEGFQWAHALGIADRRDCPGDHGPFRAGCAEEADDRAVRTGRR